MDSSWYHFDVRLLFASPGKLLDPGSPRLYYVFVIITESGLQRETGGG
jgi:hypothetical protein